MEKRIPLSPPLSSSSSVFLSKNLFSEHGQHDQDSAGKGPAAFHSEQGQHLGAGPDIGKTLLKIMPTCDTGQGKIC